ncbi:MAG: Uma2 family endonuclease [Saprospiraceae bacterium]
MTTAAATHFAPLPETATQAPRAKRPLTLEAFRRRYAKREDGYKYEYNDGEIEKTIWAMKVSQFFIVNNLTRRFTQTAAFAKGDALAIETEQVTLPNRLRRPDLHHLTAKKMKTNDESISDFVIEIISDHDNIKHVYRKLEEYFEAGVKVVWHVFPELEKVYVYTSIFDVTICKGNIRCSAAPVLPDFDLAAAEIFAKPE